MVIQNVGVVNQIFYPMATANVFIDTDENNGDWMNLRFEDEDYLIFEGLFWNKEITNYANNYENKNSEILIRVKDEDGKGVKLNKLSRSLIVEGREIELTVKEYNIMELFISNPGRATTFADLLNSLMVSW